MKKFFTDRKLNIICSVAAIVLMWVVWIIGYYAVGNDYIVPSFQDSFKEIWNCIKSKVFLKSFFNTLLRTFEVFLLSYALGGACAVLSALSKIFAKIFMPIVSFLRTLPTLAVILLILIWSNPLVAPLVVTFLVIFPMVYARIMAAVGGIDAGLKDALKVYGVSARDKIFKVYLPMISPNLLSQIGADFSLGLKVMISAEVLCNTYLSLGGMMQESKIYLEMPRLAALTLIAVAAGLVIDIALSQLARINKPWTAGEA